MDHFGSFRQEYLGPPWKAVHFDQSSHFGRSDRNVPFHLRKLIVFLYNRFLVACLKVQ